MDKYSVDVSGKNLDVPALITLLEELDILRTHSAGDSFYSESGVTKPRIREGVYDDSNVVFNSTHQSLLDLLSYLEGKIHHFGQMNVEEIIIWVTMSRSWQINGELSAKEIEKMARVGAAYCWSVILENGEG